MCGAVREVVMQTWHVMHYHVEKLRIIQMSIKPHENESNSVEIAAVSGAPVVSFLGFLL